MTAVPSWVKAADNARYQPVSRADNDDSLSAKPDAFERDISDTYLEIKAQEIVFGQWALTSNRLGTLVYTITSKEEIFHISSKPYFIWPSQRSYWTCELCPQPLGRTPEAFGYLKRCTQCNTRATRFKRAKRLVNDIDRIGNHFGLRPKWVTLTLPNYNDPLEGLADLKKKVKKFRHKNEFQLHVIGGADFYEWTSRQTGEGLSYNVHYHGLWLGHYWKQKDLMKTWKHGGARIEDCGTTKKRVNYVVNYAKKQSELGIRTSQRFGCLYGPVFHALDKYLQTQATE